MTEWRHDYQDKSKYQVPLEKCPHCGSYDYTLHKWSEGGFINFITFGLFGKRRRECEQKYCDNCGYSLEKRCVSDENKDKGA